VKKEKYEALKIDTIQRTFESN